MKVSNSPKPENKSLEIAEDAREKKVEKPSFLRELFLGNFRFDYIYPYPAC